MERVLVRGGLPTCCGVCGCAATQYSRKLARRILFTRIRLQVPLCGPHFRAAQRLNFGEKACRVLSALAALSLGALGVLKWTDRASTEPLDSLAWVAAGLALAFVGWRLLGPRLADPETRQARDCVRILNYWSDEKSLELAVENPDFARHLRSINPG